MEPYYITHDIRLCCFSASSFPDGVMEAFKKLHTKVPNQNGRRLFGISWPDGKGSMVYKAAIEEISPGETEELGAETYTLKKGEYLSLTVHNFMDDISSIGKAFRVLVDAPGVHPNTIGVEEYLCGTEVRCMVPMMAITSPN
jgi:predicted transcriptional regulator YdeE